jgi:hypothetical protein
MLVHILAAVGLVLAGCACVYLASPHQRWRVAPWPARPARAGGAALCALGLLTYLQVLQVVAAVFSFVTTLMLALVVLTYLGAWWGSSRKPEKA